MRNLVFLISATLACPAVAQTFPLPGTAGDRTSVEGSTPFLAPFRMGQELVIDRNTLEAKGLPSSFANWDMMALDPTGRYIFVPAEVGSGAGVFRYDTETGNFVTLLLGNGSGNRTSEPGTFDASNDDFARLDPATYTPWGTVLTGEETTGGRIFEITNPLSASGPFDVRWLSNIPAVSHEGVRFDSEGNLYFIDEDNSGSIYKFVPSTPGDLAAGQSFVLSADAFAADPSVDASLNWDDAVNQPADASRFGPATWVPITNASGAPLTVTNPFDFDGVNGGRNAADELKGTPYGRPEDVTINTLASGNEAVYCNVTSENRVLSIELVSPTTAMIREFVNFDTMNLATGDDVNPDQNDPYTSPASDDAFDDPDNLEVDHFGNVYIVEDHNPGDIWKAVDEDKDGVAEAIGRFLSLGPAGCEPSGFISDPNDPHRFYCNIQHPDSGNDALWAFDTCPYPGSHQDLEIRTGVNALGRSGPGEFVKSAGAGDNVLFTIDSPNGGYTFAPYVILIQPFPSTTAPRRFLPPLWISPFQPIILLSGGFTEEFQFLVAPGGSTTAVKVPKGLKDVSVLVQGFSVTPDGMLAVTDGHEVVIK